MSSPIPHPFVLFPTGQGFVDHAGPLYWVPDKDNFAVGFRVEARHVNPAGIVHGGMMVTAADMTIALGTRLLADIEVFLPTVHLDCDFLAPGRLGDWIEGRARVWRTTRRFAFAGCTLEARGETLLRASALLSIPRADDARFHFRWPEDAGEGRG